MPQCVCEGCARTESDAGTLCWVLSLSKKRTQGFCKSCCEEQGIVYSVSHSFGHLVMKIDGVEVTGRIGFDDEPSSGAGVTLGPKQVRPV